MRKTRSVAVAIVLAGFLTGAELQTHGIWISTHLRTERVSVEESHKPITLQDAITRLFQTILRAVFKQWWHIDGHDITTMGARGYHSVLVCISDCYMA